MARRLSAAVLSCLVLALAGCATPPAPPLPSDAVASVPKTVPETASDALAGWVGEYDFEESLGTSDEGTADSSVDYHITIALTGGKYVATVSLNGFQTMQNLLASVQGDANSISLIFDSYTGDNMWQPYTPGDELLMLQRQEGGLLTTWGAIVPQLQQNLVPGHYFIGNVG